MIRRRSFLKGLLAVFPLGAAAVIGGKKPAGPDPVSDPDAFRLDLEKFHRVDPALLGYEEEAPLAEGVEGASAMVLSPDGTLYIAVGGTAWLLSEDGKEAVFHGEGTITAMAVTARRTLWTAAGQILSVSDAAGQFLMEPVHMGERAYITSLAIQNDKVFAADAGQRTVWILAEEGRLKGRLEGRSEGREGTGFVVPSPWFSLAAGSGELWVANPGQQRVERFIDGRRAGNWGFASMDVEGFCGCCNPTHLALLPGGGFVTSEKGIPRVKVYDRQGNLQSVVAGADAFNEGTTGLAVAAASDGRIFVLDPVRGQVRTFTPMARERGA